MDVTPQWNVNTLVSETPQAREDRRRKVGDLFSIPKFTHDGSVQKELKKLAKSHGSGSLPQHTPAALANTDRTPGPRTTTPKPPVTSNPVGNPQIPTTTATNITPSEHTPVDLSQKRGKKRELEESGTTLSPQQIHRQATPPASVVNSLNGVRPRPIKKQRVVRYPPISSTHHDLTVTKGCPGTGSGERSSIPAATHSTGCLKLTNSLAFPIQPSVLEYCIYSHSKEHLNADIR